MGNVHNYLMASENQAAAVLDASVTSSQDSQAHMETQQWGMQKVKEHRRQHRQAQTTAGLSRDQRLNESFPGTLLHSQVKQVPSSEMEKKVNTVNPLHRYPRVVY